MDYTTSTEQFDEFANYAINKEAPQDQIMLSKKCFRAGYATLFTIVLQLIELDDADNTYMECLSVETEELAEKYFKHNDSYKSGFKHPGGIPKNIIIRSWSNYNKLTIKRLNLSPSQTKILKIAFIAGCYILFNELKNANATASNQEEYYAFLDKVAEDISDIGKEIDKEWLDNLNIPGKMQ